jgi:hypothetical protein
MDHDILDIDAADIDLDTPLPQAVMVGSADIAWLYTVGEALEHLSGLMVTDSGRDWRSIYAGFVSAIETGSGEQLRASSEALRELIREAA